MANEKKIIELNVNVEGALESITELSNKIATLEKNIKSYGKTNSDQKSNEIAQLKDYKTQLNSVVRETANEMRIGAQKIGYLEKLTAEVSNLEKAYFRLSETEFKGTQGKELLENLKKQRGALAEAQAEYGKYSMNVGNYGSATKMLGINIGQVMKELPNFAISARIGIMSLTNNLPMLAEAFQAVRVQQAQMIKEGQQAPSMFKLISQSVFGLTGIMSIAMVLIQMFGDDIIKWVGNLFKADESVRKLTSDIYGLSSATTVLNKTFKDGGGVYADAVKQINQMNVELRNAKGNHEEEKIALDKYNKGLGENFGHAKNVAEALSLIASKKDAYIDAMKSMAIANAFLAESTKSTVDIVNTMTKSQSELVRDAGKDFKSMYEEVEDYDKRIKKLRDSNSQYETTTLTQTLAPGVTTTTELKTSLSELQNLRNEAALKITNAEKGERNKQLSDLNKHQKEMSDQYEKYYSDYFDKLETAGIKTDELSEKGAEKRIKDIKYYAQATMAELEKLDKALEKEQEKIQEEGHKSLRLDVETEYGKNDTSNGLDERVRQAELESKQKLENLRNEFADRAVLAEGEFGLQKELLDQRMRDELAVTGLTEEQKALIRERYRRSEIKLELDKTQFMLNTAGNLANAIATLAGKETKLGKAAAVTGITINAIQGGIAAVTKGVEQMGPVAGAIVGGAEAAAIAISAASAIKQVLSTKEPNTSDMSSAASSVKTSVTEKLHSGGIEYADNQLKSDEITRTLLRTERVLSPVQTGIFDTIVNKMQSYGGSGNITSNVGVDTFLQETMLERAFSRALVNQKPQQISWTEFSNQAQRQQELENNLFIS